MEFDRRTRYTSTRGAATHDAQVPGRQTLTQGMVQLPPDTAPSSPRSETAATPSLPVPSGPRPTLQMLFGRRGPASDPEQVHAAAARGAGSAASQLPHLEQIQRSFGRHDISGVQAHVGAEAAASAQEMGAAAYATGNHVVLGAGTDLHTVAHEAAHVVQQRGGVQLKAGVGEVGDAYERHADEVADAVVKGESAEALLDRHSGGGARGTAATSGLAVQRDEWESEIFGHVGFKFGDLTRAARTQNTPETCWACALAMAASLLGREDWDNELKWYQTAKRAGLVMEHSTRILPENLDALVNGIQGFHMHLYGNMGTLAGQIGQALRSNKVVLLMSEQHVILVGQLQMEKTNQAMNYHVIDSATGVAATWSQETFNDFQPLYGAIVS